MKNKLLTLRPGDKVRLRNGEIATVLVNDGSAMPFQIETPHNEAGAVDADRPWLHRSGRYVEVWEHDLDIVEVMESDQTLSQMALDALDNLLKHCTDNTGESIIRQALEQVE